MFWFCPVGFTCVVADVLWLGIWVVVCGVKGSVYPTRTYLVSSSFGAAGFRVVVWVS